MRLVVAMDRLIISFANAQATLSMTLSNTQVTESMTLLIILYIILVFILIIYREIIFNVHSYTLLIFGEKLVEIQ